MIGSDANWSFILTKLLKLLLDTTKTVYSTVELVYSEQEEEWTDKKTFRDNLNMAAFITDNAIIDTVTTILAFKTTLKQAEINLRADGNVVIDGEKIKQISQVLDTVETPSTAIQHGFAIAKLSVAITKELPGYAKLGIQMRDLSGAVNDAKETQKDPSEEL